MSSFGIRNGPISAENANFPGRLNMKECKAPRQALGDLSLNKCLTNALQPDPAHKNSGAVQKPQLNVRLIPSNTDGIKVETATSTSSDKLPPADVLDPEDMVCTGAGKVNAAESDIYSSALKQHRANSKAINPRTVGKTLYINPNVMCGFSASTAKSATEVADELQSLAEIMMENCL